MFPNLSCVKIHKSLYFINQYPDLIMKKTNQKELNLHYKALDILQNIYVPKIAFTMSIDETVYIVMEKIKGMSVADMYGENPLDIPVNIFEQIRNILHTLKNHKLDYIDITGYNFIVDEDHKIHIIDFEHSIDRNIDKNINDGKSWFLNEFLDGNNDWNPDFR